MRPEEQLRVKMIALARDLLRRTVDGEISWRTTDKESRFLFSGTNASVTVNTYENRASRDPNGISMALLNSRGAVVDSIEKAQLPSDDPWSEDDDGNPAGWNELLEDLYNAARRSALKVDEVIDSLFEDLKHGRVDNSVADTGFSDEPPF